ncbi:hypothetical protein [Pinirhizobacter sp.]|jgi:Flp pilus assembly pilin Flp|uniref:hypothetical protein n=1 Tax=Pinirhizobacter sp. TaxID=2950432 RepID=UPI002F3EAA2C
MKKRFVACVAGRRRQRGAAMVEYSIGALMLVLVLVAVNPNAIEQLVTAIRDAYTSFVYALSVSWF